MHCIKIICIGVCLLTLSACSTKTEKIEGHCFLKGFFNQQALELNNGNKKLQKAVYYEGVMNDTLLAKPIWKDEFELFYNNLPDSMELLEKFERDYKVDGNREREQFVKVDENGNSETIEVVYIDKSIISVRMNTTSSDRLSSQELGINYNTGKSIGAKGSHNLLSGKRKEFEIYGEVVQ